MVPSNSALQVEVVGMERLDLDKTRRIPYQPHQATSEFINCRPGKCQHQQFLILHILHSHNSCQLMDQQFGLPASGTGSHQQVPVLPIVQNRQLSRRELPESCLNFAGVIILRISSFLLPGKYLLRKEL